MPLFLALETVSTSCSATSVSPSSVMFRDLIWTESLVLCHTIAIPRTALGHLLAGLWEARAGANKNVLSQPCF